MPKQKFFIHNVSLKLQDPEYKKLTLACYRRRRNRSEIIRHLINTNIDALLSKSPKHDHEH